MHHWNMTAFITVHCALYMLSSKMHASISGSTNETNEPFVMLNSILPQNVALCPQDGWLCHFEQPPIRRKNINPKTIVNDLYAQYLKIQFSFNFTHNGKVMIRLLLVSFHGTNSSKEWFYLHQCHRHSRCKGCTGNDMFQWQSTHINDHLRIPARNLWLPSNSKIDRLAKVSAKQVLIGSKIANQSCYLHKAVDNPLQRVFQWHSEWE